MSAGGRGAFRTETRTARLERLHGPKRRMLSPEDAKGIGESSRSKTDRWKAGDAYRSDLGWLSW